MLLKKIILLILSIFVLFLLIFLIGQKFYSISFLKLKSKLIKDFKQYPTQTLVIQSKKHGETSVYRFDKPDTKLYEGNYNVIFFSPERLAVFGMHKDTPTKQSYYIISKNQIRRKNISSLPGPVTFISASPDLTNYLISGITINKSGEKQTYYSCLTTDNQMEYDCSHSLQMILDNNNIDSNTHYSISWLPKSTSTLIISNTNNKTFKYLVNENKLISSTLDYPENTQNEIDYTVKQWKKYILISKKDSKKIISIPEENNLKLLPLSNQFMLAMKVPTEREKKVEIYLIDIDNGFIAKHTDVPNDNAYNLSFFGTNFKYAP